MKKLNYDKFILIIGHARSGTSLCSGLLNESPEINIGLEINNLNLMRRSVWIEDIFPKEFTGNKICIFQDIFCDEIIKSIKDRKGIMHDRWKDLKIIFTKRNALDSMISKKFRGLNKGQDLEFVRIVRDYAKFENEIIKLKKYFDNHFVFDFDKAVLNSKIAKRMFEYVEIEYSDEYYTQFRGIKPYFYGKGVSPNYIQFGISGKCEKERKTFKELIESYEPWLLKNEKNSKINRL